MGRACLGNEGVDCDDVESGKEEQKQRNKRALRMKEIIDAMEAE